MSGRNETKRKHMIRMGIRVRYWARVTQLQDIFYKEYRPSDGIYMESTPRVTLKATHHGGELWELWLEVESQRKPAASVIDMYRCFLQGALAAALRIDPHMLETTDAQNSTSEH